MADEIIVETTSTEVIEVAVPGPQGATGQGVPVGGTTGQVLRKVSGTNYDTEWAAAGSGSGSVTSVALAGTGLSISGSPITTSGTITANVSYGTTAGTATQGNDSRIANIAANSITTANSGGAGGTITMRGGITGSNGAGGNAGSINLQGSDDRDEGAFNGGSIDLSAANGAGGNITSTGNSEGAGGSLTMSGNGFAGGSINTSGSSNGAGGSIDTSNDGGSINTRGTGSIGFGESGTRTTLTGTATANRAISLPDAGGTLALTQQATDYEVTDDTKGVIMKSPNGTRWRVTIDNNGSLLRTAIALLLSAFLVCGAKAQVRDLVYGTDNVVIGPTNTNALSFTNRVSLPISSGAATTNSILTADGAGGSAFVASRTVARILTNDYAKTNWGTNTFSAGANAEAAFGTWSLDANSVYQIEWAIAYTYTTNAVGPQHGVVFSGNIYVQTNSALGWVSVPAGGGVQQIIPTALTWIDFNAATNATGTRFRTGTVRVPTGTNAITAQFHWCPVASNSNALTLLRGSTVSITKMAP